MTNDLMRDLIENRIPGHETPTFVWVTITPEVRRLAVPPKTETYADWMQMMDRAMARAYENLQMAAMGAVRTTHFTGEPTDPRERALWAKQQRGTGPDVPVRERGLVTRYQTKG